MSLYKRLLKIPVVSTVCNIVISYAFRGEEKAIIRFSWIVAIIKALYIPIGIAFLLSAVTLQEWLVLFFNGSSLSTSSLSSFTRSPGALIISVVPSLLGFGIGVYALTFIIPRKTVHKVDKAFSIALASGRKKYGSVLVLNADMGFPLIVLILALCIGVIQQIFPCNKAILVLAWIMFWMSMVALLEIVGVLFQLGDHAILDKLDSKLPSDE